MGINNLTGAWGETVAAEYLRKKGYKILGVNYRCRFGELDIIAEKRKILAFVEVKTRKNDDFARAMEYVDHHKQEKLRKTAAKWISENETKLQPRFDVIEIYAPEGPKTGKPKVYHWEDAFQ